MRNSMDPTRPTRVAEAILQQYNSLKVKDDGWTVVAGIAAVDAAGRRPRAGGRVRVQVRGQAGEVRRRRPRRPAEVVARRAFRRALLDDPEAYEIARRGECWLFATAPPCGDAAIYELDDLANCLSGAKLGDWRREDAQVTGAVRLKPGRSDVPVDPRSGSLSCSDKILKWSVCGLPGALLRARFPDDIPLKGVVVAAQPRAATLEQALDRALFQRAEYLAAACHQRPPLLRTRVTDVGATSRRDGAEAVLVNRGRGGAAAARRRSSSRRRAGRAARPRVPRCAAPRDGVFSRKARRPRPRGAVAKGRDAPSTSPCAASCARTSRSGARTRSCRRPASSCRRRDGRRRAALDDDSPVGVVKAPSSADACSTACTWLAVRSKPIPASRHATSWRETRRPVATVVPTNASTPAPPAT